MDGAVKLTLKSSSTIKKMDSIIVDFEFLPEKRPDICFIGTAPTNTRSKRHLLIPLIPALYDPNDPANNMVAAHKVASDTGTAYLACWRAGTFVVRCAYVSSVISQSSKGLQFLAEVPTTITAE